MVSGFKSKMASMVLGNSTLKYLISSVIALKMI
jgi:hypothetical protein